LLKNGFQVFVQGDGMPKSLYTLQWTPQLAPTANWTSGAQTVSDESGHFQFFGTSTGQWLFLRVCGPPIPE
jgi:hypothetical protein